MSNTHMIVPTNPNAKTTRTNTMGANKFLMSYISNRY